MPIFALFAGVFALSSLAFPGTNSFIGEFLVMSGGFASAVQGVSPSVTMLMMVCVVPGVVLAAAYMLRMLQKVAYGGTRNPDHSHVKDLGFREILTLAPLLVFVFWIGLHPEPFTRVMDASVTRLMEQTRRPAAGDYAVQPKAAGTPRSEGRDPKETQAAGDSKSEGRNPSSEKPQLGHQERSQASPQARVLNDGRPFRISSFGFPSDLGLRISDLVMRPAVPALLS
jgi:hypothetical protein